MNECSTKHGPITFEEQEECPACRELARFEAEYAAMKKEFTATRYRLDKVVEEYQAFGNDVQRVKGALEIRLYESEAECAGLRAEMEKLAAKL